MDQQPKANDDIRLEYDFSDGVRGKYYEAYQQSSNVQSTVTLQQALETVEKLPFEQQEMLLEILKRRHVEIRREAIAVATKEALADFRAGRLKVYSSADELIAELREYLDEPEE